MGSDDHPAVFRNGLDTTPRQSEFRSKKPIEADRDRVRDHATDLQTSYWRDALIGQQPHHPFQREGDFAGLIDARERLQGEGAFEAELDGFPAHGQRRGSGGASPVDEDHLRTAEASELQGEQRQQH